MGNDVLEDGTAPSAGRAPSSAVTPTGTAGGATPTGERVYDEIAGGDVVTRVTTSGRCCRAAAVL